MLLWELLVDLEKSSLLWALLIIENYAVDPIFFQSDPGSIVEYILLLHGMGQNSARM